MYAVRTVILKEIVTDAACSAARVFKDPTVENWNDKGGMIPWDRNTVGMTPVTTTLQTHL